MFCSETIPPSFNLMDAVEIIEELQTLIAWHPFPEVEPEEAGRYWVALKDDSGDYDYGVIYFEDSYENDEWSSAVDQPAHVIAWMPLPEPYEGTDAV